MSLGACEICNNSFCDSSVYCMKGNSSFSAELSLITGGSILAQLNSKWRTCIYSMPLWINEGLQSVSSLLSRVSMYVTTHVSLRAKAQPNLIQTRGNIYPILQNLSPKSFSIVLNSNSIPLMIKIKMSAISDFSSPPTASRPCRLYPEPSPTHHLHHWHSGLSHYHLLPGSRQLHVGWYLLPLTLTIVSSTATTAVLLETGHSSVSH